MNFFQKILGTFQKPQAGPAPESALNTIALLIVDRNVTADASPETRFGGLPSAGEGFAWPRCRSCGEPMQFQGQIRPPGALHLHLIFMCTNHPGECDQFEADGGGNAVITVPVDGLQLATPPAEGETLRDTRYGAHLLTVAAREYSDAFSAYAGRRREVLGQIGGAADWIQHDDTPACSACKAPMQFVAQLEPGPDYQTEMNFAGGCGYLFECRCSGVSGKFLWQC